MGRGLSDIQKRILAYAYRAQGLDDPDPHGPGPHPVRSVAAPWFDEWRAYRWCYEISPARDIMPRKEPDEWTPADRAAVSRALTRLERRGMITRGSRHDPVLGPRVRHRTDHISLTDYGKAFHEYVVAAARLAVQ